MEKYINCSPHEVDKILEEQGDYYTFYEFNEINIVGVDHSLHVPRGWDFAVYLKGCYDPILIDEDTFNLETGELDEKYLMYDCFSDFMDKYPDHLLEMRKAEESRPVFKTEDGLWTVVIKPLKEYIQFFTEGEAVKYLLNRKESPHSRDFSHE